MGQKVRVQSITSRDGGTTARPWTLFKIITDKDVKFSCFDKTIANVKEGAVLELDEVEVTEKGNNIIKWHLLEEGTGDGQAASSSSGGESPEKNKSTEDETRAYIIADLYKDGKLLLEDYQVKNLLDWLGKLGKPGPAPEKTKPAKQTDKALQTDKTLESAMESGDFENVGQLLTACGQKFKMSRDTVLAEAGVSDPREITDLKTTWLSICATHLFD